MQENVPIACDYLGQCIDVYFTNITERGPQAQSRLLKKSSASIHCLVEVHDKLGTLRNIQNKYRIARKTTFANSARPPLNSEGGAHGGELIN